MEGRDQANKGPWRKRGAKRVRRPGKPAARPGPSVSAKPSDTAWVENAQWYDQLVGDAGSEYHQHVVLPGVLKLLGVSEDARVKSLRGRRILDLCCGQGVLCRLLQKLGAQVTGVDASAPLIEMARQRGPAELHYVLADAAGLFSRRATKREKPQQNAGEKPASPKAPMPGSFDTVVCVLALQDVAELDTTFATVSSALRPGGHFIAVVMHPCFRTPKHSHWGWDEKAQVQYRRIDRYLTPFAAPIQTHPGSDPKAATTTHHRPLADYINAMSRQGLLIEQFEEWTSHKKSDSGPRAPAENVARRELPMFLALRAVKVLKASEEPEDRS